jgi:hypothetical protein
MAKSIVEVVPRIHRGAMLWDNETEEFHKTEVFRPLDNNMFQLYQYSHIIKMVTVDT